MAVGTLSNGVGMQNCSERRGWGGSWGLGDWGGADKHVWGGGFVRMLEREDRGTRASHRCLGTGQVSRLSQEL